jgi:transcriptional regulator with XRE-family HTH domain
MRAKHFEMIVRTKKGDGNIPIPNRINLSKLALKTGFSPSHMSRVFRGETFPSIKCLHELSEAMDIDMGKLYNYFQGVRNETRSVRVQGTSIRHQRT